MAIAFDAVSQGSVGSATSLTVAHTCTGSNLLLLVHVLTNNTTDIITGVTYAGVPMTQILKQQSAVGYFEYVYYLLAPSTGANNIVASFSGTSVIGVQGTSYTGVSQSAFPDASAKAAPTSGTSINAAITTVADNCWHWSASRTGGAATVTAGGVSRNATPFGGIMVVADSNGPITPAGSHSITLTATINNETQWLTVSFAPSGGGGGASSHGLSLMGVGS